MGGGKYKDKDQRRRRREKEGGERREEEKGGRKRSKEEEERQNQSNIHCEPQFLICKMRLTTLPASWGWL